MSHAPHGERVIGRRPPPRRLRRAARRHVALLLCALLIFAGAGCAAGTSTGTTADVAGTLPFADGEVLRYSLHDDLGGVIGYGELSVRLEGDALVLGQRYVEADPPTGAAPTTDDIVLRVDPRTLKPIAGTRVVDTRVDPGAREQVDYGWTYGSDDRDRPVMTATWTRGTDHGERTLRLREHAYDNESSLWLWRTLAYADGYEAQYVSLNATERSQQSVNVRVPLRQTITVPAGTFDTWRLLIRNGRAVRTAWVNVASPHEVVQWDNGNLVFQLEPR